MHCSLAVACALGFTAALLAPSVAGAQGTRGLPSTSDLYQTVRALDAKMFQAYNSCDLAAFRSLLDERVEFYHDQGGVTLGADDLVASIKRNICGKVRRDLVTSTLEVHEMKGYGALEIGVHRFFEILTDPVHPTGESRFTQLWRRDGDTWTLSRVLSFDHRGLPMPKARAKKPNP